MRKHELHQPHYIFLNIISGSSNKYEEKGAAKKVLFHHPIPSKQPLASHPQRHPITTDPLRFRTAKKILLEGEH